MNTTAPPNPLLTVLREQVGLAMGSLHGHRHIGHTTDQAKADAACEAGATVRACGNNGNGPPSDGEAVTPKATFPAWEVSIPVGHPEWAELGQDS